MSIDRECTVPGKCAVQTKGFAADLFPYGEQTCPKNCLTAALHSLIDYITHCFN